MSVYRTLKQRGLDPLAETRRALEPLAENRRVAAPAGQTRFSELTGYHKDIHS